MELNEVIRIVNLLRKVDCTKYALISDVAKEMGVKKTVLMQFIEDNPKLFRTSELYRYQKNTKKSMGLAICEVYQTAEENPETEEWLEVKKKAWEKKIHIGEQTYYGVHEYWFVPVDGEKEGKYRNTQEKIKFLEEKGIIKKVSGGYGGFSDYYPTKYYKYDDDVQKALEGIGWTTDFDEVSANTKK